MKEQRGSVSERWAIIQLYTYASWLRAKQAKSDRDEMAEHEK
jgi:hypothetical protein